jgi:tetratricopeptide (TPR) repeat protein
MHSYHKSVQIAPSGAGYFNIGVCYFQMGTKNAEILYSIYILTLLLIGKHKDAIKSFERSLEYTPNSADAHTNIASGYLMLKDTTNAIKHLEQASNFNPLDGEVQYNLACVYEAVGRLEDAKTRFERAELMGIDRAVTALEKLKQKM